MAYWIDNADSYICSICGYECNNPNKEKYGADVCPNCGTKMNGGRTYEYIEREALMEEADRQPGGLISNKTIQFFPTADVAPVRHGRWENGNPICPVCGGDKFKDLDADIWCDWQPAFCPNCGAKMDLEEG